MSGKYTYDEIKREFEDRDYILITDHKVKSNEKYEYVCKKHQDKGSQFIDWGHFHCNGRGCYYCGRERTEAARRSDLSKYDGKSLAESKEFEYVGMTRHDKKIWVQFICPKHRQYGVQEMPYNNMKRVTVGCRHCIRRDDDEQEVLAEMYKANHYMILLEPYQGRTKRVLMKCLLHNIECRKTPAEVIDGKGCYLCGLEKIRQSQLISQEEFENRVYYRNPHIRIDGRYTGTNNPVDCYCLKHNVNFSRLAVSLYSHASGCDRCYMELFRQRNGFTKDTYVESLHSVFPYIDLIGDYLNLQEKTGFYCSKCKTMWIDKPILVRDRGCLCCEHDRSENLVGQILDKYNIRYKRQHTFNDCIDRRKLPFDFYLIDYNIIIEYDGEQHYMPINFGGISDEEAYEKFLITQNHDQIKNTYCQQHKINLIRIPYWGKHNIESIILDKIKNMCK